MLRHKEWMHVSGMQDRERRRVSEALPQQLQALHAAHTSGSGGSKQLTDWSADPAHMPTHPSQVRCCSCDADAHVPWHSDVLVQTDHARGTPAEHGVGPHVVSSPKSHVP
jgi:hypothetical protein